MSACGLVGWMSKSQLCSEDRHCRVGTYCPLGWQRTLVFEDHLRVHLMQAEISLARRYALQTFWGSARSFHTCFVVLLAPRLGSMRLPQSLFSESGYGFPSHFVSDWYRQGRPMNHWLNRFPFSGVAAACFKQELPEVGTVADVTDVHVFKRWGEVWRFKS